MAAFRLISVVSEEVHVVTQIAKNCSRRQPHSRSFEAPANMRMHQKLESLAYVLVADSMTLKDASFLRQSAYWPFKVVQCHPRSMILVPIESAYATSY